MATYVVDTHALLWFLTANPRLGEKARNALADPESELVVPAIVLAESLWIVDKLASQITASDVLAAIDADPRISVYPMTRDIVAEAHALSAIAEMHDRQIAATANGVSQSASSVALLTKDEDIIGSGLVPTLW